MATAVSAASTSSGSVKSLPGPVKLPLMVLASVFFNALAMSLGIKFAYPISCGLVAGGIDGAILAAILVYKFGEKLRAGAAGLLGGYGYHEVASGYDLVKKYGDWLHAHSEIILVAMLGPEGPLHKAVLSEVKWVASTAGVVIMMSLLIELIWTARSRTADGRGEQS